MKSIELNPILMKNKYTDFYGIGQVVYKENEITLLDCGFPTAKIVNGEFELCVLHPTELELDIIREFAWQHGFTKIRDMKAKDIRKKYGAHKYLSYRA